MKNLSKKLIPSPTKEEQEKLVAYHNYFEGLKPEFDIWVEKKLENHPFLGPLLKKIPKALREKEDKISQALQKDAVCNGNWEPFVINLIQQGITYAKLGMEFRTWYEVIHLVRVFVFPRLIKDRETKGTDILPIIEGLNSLMDIAMGIIGEAYVYEKKSILEKQKQEQENLNKELEQFVYIASHDLQEPLITVTGLTNMLEKNLRGTNNKKADDYLKFIRESTERMTVLITGLLEYSRVGRKSSLRKTNLNNLIKDVLGNLNGSIQNNNAEVNIGNLPTLTVHPIEIKLLFQNLISNAIKFKRKNIPPKISVTAQLENGNWHFKVKDNGIGIDNKDSEKIFVIFKRLNNAREFDGTGIGLAHCKKIVEMHQGKIWVESKVNEGSTFHFVIPETQEK